MQRRSIAWKPWVEHEDPVTARSRKAITSSTGLPLSMEDAASRSRALETFYDATASQAYALAMHLGDGDAPSAQALVVDTYNEMYRFCPTPLNDGAARRLLLRCVRQRHLDQRRASSSAADVASREMQPGEAQRAGDNGRRVAAMPAASVAPVQDNERVAVDMAYREGRDAHAIAHHMRLDVRAVYGLLRSGLRRKADAGDTGRERSTGV